MSCRRWLVMLNKNIMDKLKQKELSLEFVKAIVDDEWEWFAGEQTERINAHKLIDTGHLIGAGRRFSTSGKGETTEAHLIHPDYERFIDIKKLKFYKRGHTDQDRLGRERKGKQIHNSPVFTALNRIAYRVNWDLAEEILGSDLPAGMQINLTLAGPFRGR